MNISSLQLYRKSSKVKQTTSDETVFYTVNIQHEITGNYAVFSKGSVWKYLYS